MMLTLPGHWYVAAPSSELGRSPIRREVEGRTLVLFRDEAGTPHALEDRCLHRGMALSAGKVKKGCLECPYHGWRYDGAGQLVEVPALCEGERLPRLTAPGSPTRESDDHLWVWIGDSPPDSDPPRFPGCGQDGWSSFFLHTRFEAPVEVCLENFLDVPHTVFVHPGLFRGKVQRPTRARVRQTESWVEAEFLDEAALEGIGPRLLFPRGARLRHTDRFLLPSTTRVDYTFGEEHGFVITSRCTQREECVVDVTTAISWRLALPSWTRPVVRAFLKNYCRRVIQQDVRALATLGRQWKRFGATSCHTSADLLGPAIHLLRRRAAEGLTEKIDHVRETQLKI